MNETPWNCFAKLLERMPRVMPTGRAGAGMSLETFVYARQHLSLLLLTEPAYWHITW